MPIVIRVFQENKTRHTDFVVMGSEVFPKTNFDLAVQWADEMLLDPDSAHFIYEIRRQRREREYLDAFKGRCQGNLKLIK
jgi:hypothetical protein